ncbi:hypothetical protein GOX01_07400 [Gluconobacter oxydans]|nr:hypothetical protein GOX01_07400 [Gluconobacter oxydans]
MRTRIGRLQNHRYIQRRTPRFGMSLSYKRKPQRDMHPGLPIRRNAAFLQGAPDQRDGRGILSTGPRQTGHPMQSIRLSRLPGQNSPEPGLRPRKIPGTETGKGGLGGVI